MCQAQEVLRNSGKTTAWQTEEEAGVTTFALVQTHELETDTHTHSTRTPLESSRLQDPPKTKPVHNREQNLPIHGCTFLLVSCLICTVGTPSSFRTPNSSIALILWSQFHVRTQIKTKASNKSNHKNLYPLLRRPHILVAAKSRTTSMQEQELWAQLWPPGHWGEAVRLGEPGQPPLAAPSAELRHAARATRASLPACDN